MLSLQHCCCGSDACFSCSPCPIPQTDLSLTITSSLYGAGTTTLVYNGTTSTWSGSWSFVGGLTHYTYTATLKCLSASIQFCITDTPPTDNCCNGGFGLHLLAFTCSPLHLDFDFDPIVTVVCDNDQTLGFTHFRIDGPADTTCPCSATVHVNGCNSIGVAGAAVTIKNAGGTTIDSGTTDASGNFSASVTGTNLTVQVAKTRFFSHSSVGHTIGCTIPVTIGLSPSTGFDCFFGCAVPVPETLTMTFATAGAVTLTYSGGQWAGSFTASGQSYGVFIATSGLILIQRNGSNCPGVGMTVTSCPPSFSASIVIGGTCASEIGSTATLTE